MNKKPFFTIVTEETLRDYSNSSRRSRYQTHIYPTYEALLKGLKTILHLSVEGPVHVTRFRRGEWGEWFENWDLVGGKPTIIKQGWM